MTSKSLKISSALALVSMVLYLTTFRFGFRPLSIISAESTLSMPTVAVEWMTWRCRLRGVDGVEVDQAERADAGGGEIERERRAEAAGADAEDLGGLELLLALVADLGQDEVAGVAGDFLVGELGEGGDLDRVWRWTWVPRTEIAQ